MCTVVNFNEYRFKTTKKTRLGEYNPTKKTELADTKIGIKKISGNRKLVSEEWCKEYMSHRWGLMKLIYHVIEQCGYIFCDGKKHMFEDVKRDVRYYQMCPQIENKRFKAPLYVKIMGEWYFIEVFTDDASLETYKEKFIELGNYAIKGFLVDLMDIKKHTLKRMLAENDIAGAARMICYEYKNTRFIHSKDYSECKAFSSFGCEKAVRECTYKPVEFKLYEYAILEGMELKTGEKHLVLLYENDKSKEYAERFKKQYKNAGIPLLYAKWDSLRENWGYCISHKPNLDKRLKVN